MSSQTPIDFDALWDYDHPAESERRFRELMPQAQTVADLGYYLELQTQIARTLGLQRNFVDANRLLDDVHSRLSPQTKRAEIRYLLERGRVLNSSGHPADAKALFLDALDLATQLGEDFHAIDAAHMLGIVEPTGRQLAWSLRELDMAEHATDPRASNWRGSLYNNIGWSYHDLGQYETALEMFQKALAFRQEQGQAGPILIARWCVARAHRSLGRIAQALAEQQQLLADHEQAGSRDGFVLEEVAECLLALGRADEARPFFARAYAELAQDAWLAQGEPERIQRLKELGGVKDVDG
jgi:tetratricopeptide (TPR) repeat protein